MGKGKKFLSLFLAAAMAVTGINISSPAVTVQAEETTAQSATVDFALEHFEASGPQGELPKVLIAAKSGEDAAGTAHNAALRVGTGDTDTSQNAGSYFSSGGRVAAVQFKIADGLSEEEIGKAVLKITFPQVDNVGGNGNRMRLGVFETEVESFSVVADANANCTTGDGAFPAVNNDYSYDAAMWSNFIAQGTAKQVAEVDVTRAVKNAVKAHRSSIVLRLQVPTGGGRIAGVKKLSGDNTATIEDAPALTVIKSAPVTIQYVSAVSSDNGKVIRAPKTVRATIGESFTYEVPQEERIITADDGTGIVTYEYAEGNTLDVVNAVVSGDNAANVITLKYKEKLADRAQLTAKINAVKDKVEADYTPATWALFKAALDHAREVEASRYATPEEIAEALEALNAANDALEFSEEGKKHPASDADKAELAAYISALEAGIVENAEYEVSYSESARATFEAAVKAAKDKTITTLKDIEDVKISLKAAEAALKSVYVTPYDGKAADVAALSGKISEAEDLLTDENKAKDEDAYNTLKAAKDAAVTAKTTALATVVTKGDVTSATTTLSTAITTFKSALIKADAKAELASIIAEADKIKDNEQSYTPESWKIFKEAYDEAKALDTNAADTAAIISAASKLSNAQKALVGKIAVTGVSLNKKTLELKIGVEETLTAVIAPSNATEKELSWSSDNKDIADVDQNGKVTAKAAGSAVITVTTKNGFKDTCTVTVTAEVQNRISLNKSKATLAAKKKITLKATTVPADAKVTWKSSKESIATVKGGVVTAKKAGTTVITATAGGKTAKCTITVVSLSLAKATLGVKETLTLKVNGAAKKAKITWKSSNSKVAAVSKSGKVSAKKANKKAVKITAKVDGVTLACNVAVKAAPKKITLNAKSKSLKKGKTFQIKVKKYSPKSAASYKLTYKVDKKGKKVVKVDSNGKVKALKKGKATITVTTFNKKKATVKITVR